MATAKGPLMRSRLIKIISGLVAFSTVYATDVSGTISSNTTWSLANSPYVVTGNILVNSGVTLTIEAGVTIKFDSGKTFQNKGTVTAIGTSSNPIIFTSNQSSLAAGDWGYLDFADNTVDASYDGNGDYSSGTILKYVQVLYGGGTSSYGAINVTNSSIHMDNVTVKYSKYYGIVFAKGSGGTIPVSKIINSSISNNGSTGIYCNCYQYNVSITVTNSTIKNNSGAGISTGGGDSGGSHTFTYTNNTIISNTGDGITANANGTQTITGNIINGNSSEGVRSRGNGTYTINNNIITNNGADGIHGIYTTHVIDNNVIANNVGGIEISQGGGYTVTDNQIYNNNNSGESENNGSGFDSDNAWSPSVTIQRNTFTRNTSITSTVYALQPNSGDPSFIFNNNNIFNNTSTYELKNARTSSISDLDAENNYWGTTTSSEIADKIYDWNDSGTLGVVDYNPYLSALDTDAPISPPSSVSVEPSGSGVKLTWTANSESDVAGYKVHYGSFTGYSYTNNVDAGNVTTYTISSGVTTDSSISVTAYDSDANGTDDQVEGYQSWFSLADPIAKVSSISSSTANGSYNAGDVIAITITFSEAVTVTGTPQLTLETGTNDVVVDFSSGSGGTTLTFNYTVASGHTSSDLDYKSTTALALNSGTIKDSGSNNASLTLPSPGDSGSLGANKALIIDTTAPTVSGVTATTADGTYKVGDAVSIIVGLSEVVTVTGTPRIQLETGTTYQYATYASGTGNDTLTFTYTVAASDTTADLDYLSTSALGLNSGTIKDAAGNATTLTLASPGATNSLGKNKAIVIDGNVPTVSSVTSAKTDAAYGVGTIIPITITFNQTVTVTGTPQLTLETGTTDAVVDYASGTGTVTLTFNYLIAAGHTSSDLDYVSTSALTLNSGTIKDASGNVATLTLATPGETNSLGANKALIIDTTGPTVSTVSSTTTNAAYKEGDTIVITATFNEPTYVTGTPQITLETGTTDAVVDYTSGTSTSTLTFNYVIVTGHNSSELDYTSTSALVLNSGTVKDSIGNDATLTLPSPGATGSLGANTALIVDTASPTFTITPADASTGVTVSSNITMTFNEFIRKTDDTALTNDNVDALITLKDTNVNGTDIAFDATINSDKTIITVDPTTDFSSEQVVYAAIGATVEDSLDHGTVTGNTTFTVKDVIAPTVSIYPAHGDEGIGTNVVLGITFSEPIRNIDNSEITNSSAASHVSLKSVNSEGADFVFSTEINVDKTEIKITPLFNFDAQKVIYVGIGSTVEDDADNAITLTSSTFRTGMGADLTGPSVDGVTSPNANTTYSAGDSITITITFNETAYVTGEPQLLLETGVNDAITNYMTGSGTKILSFNYVITSEHNSNDLDYTSADALTLNEGKIKDFVGNDGILSLPEPGSAGSLAANKAIKIDNIGPSVKWVNATTENGAYNAGDTLLITINFDENVLVTGTPQLNLETGSTDGTASYLSGSGDTLLVFKFGIDSLYNTGHLDYLSTSALELNSGTMKDAVGNNATLTLPATGAVNSLGSNKAIIIDNIAPVITLVAEGSTDGVDIDYQASSNSLALSWMGTDSVSGISKYEYALGTQSGNFDIINWKDTTIVNSAVISGLSLWDATKYFSSVRATDKAGNMSSVLSGDGITIDLSAPMVGTVNDGTGEDIWATVFDNKLSANWSGFSDATSGIADYEFAIGTTSGGTDTKDWTSNGLETTFTITDLTLIYTKTYFVSVRATDLVGNVSNVASSNGVVVDTYLGSPSITAASIESNSTLPVLTNTKVIFTISEPIMAATSKVTSNLGDTVSSTLSIENDTEISVDLAAPFTSGDQIAVTIDGLTDLLGNITNGLEYLYNIALIADYNVDGSIDAADLTVLINGWTAKDYAYELGPAAGDVPNLKPSTDGKYDIMDAAVLIRMWHWNLNKSGKMLSRYVNLGKELAYINENNTLSIQVSKDVNAVDFYFDYPQDKVSIKQSQESSSDKEIMLTHLDTLNGKFIMTAGYLEQKLQSIEVPYIINGREDVTITAIYRMFNTNGEVISQGTKEITLKPVPQEFALHQNYPNPFNPVTTINYDLPQQTYVNLMIYDILGREVVKLISEEIPAGYQSVIWNTRNTFGTPVSAGIYFYQIQTKDFVNTRKMVLLK